MKANSIIECISILNKCWGNTKKLFNVLKDVNNNKQHFKYLTQKESFEYIATFKIYS